MTREVANTLLYATMYKQELERRHVIAQFCKLISRATALVIDIIAMVSYALS